MITMKEKELRRFSRRQLLELMLEQSKQIDKLESELKAAQEQLKTRSIVAREAGSIAQAALQLSGIFETAQQAADLYLKSVYSTMPPGREEKPRQNAADAQKRESGAPKTVMSKMPPQRSTVQQAGAPRAPQPQRNAVPRHSPGSHPVKPLHAPMQDADETVRRADDIISEILSQFAEQETTDFDF